MCLFFLFNHRQKLILIILCLLLCGYYTGFAYSDSEIIKDKWLRNFKLQHLETTTTTLTTELTLEIINNNELTKPSPQIRGRTFFYLVAPTPTPPDIKILDYTYSIFKHDHLIGTYTRNETSEFTLPADSYLLSAKVMDYFRNFVILRLDFVGADYVRVAEKEEFQFVIQRLKCVLTFPAPKHYDFDVKTNDTFGIAFLQKLVANPADMELFAQPDPDIMQDYSLQTQFAERINAAYDRAPVVKVVVTRPGIQKVSFEELKKSGIPAEKLPLKNLKLFFQNREVPVFLERGESKFDTFSAGDSLYFYAPDPRENKHNYEIYWLIADGDNTPPPLIMELVQHRATETMPIIQSGWYDKKFYLPKHYHHFISMPLVSSRWYWDTIKQGEFKEYPFYLYGIDQTSEDCTFTIKIGTIERNKTNICKIYVNEKPFETIEWLGWKTNIWSKNIPPSFLQEGFNKIAIEIPDSGDKEKFNSELCLFGFEFKYKGMLQTEEDCMSFTLTGDTETSMSQIQFKIGSANLPVYVFNVTNPAKPYMLQPFFTGVGHRRVVDEVQRESKYYIITTQGANIPRLIQLRKPLTLLENKNGADYLIITHSRFTAHLKPLVEEREKAGLRVFVAEIDDVYDNFSYGCKESYAIKNFIKYVYYKWQPPRLSYVLLVGEASDIQGDPTEYSPDIQEDLIPVYNSEQPETFARADNQYTIVTGKLIPDIPIGRFSVNTIEELKTCIEKTLHYPKEQATFGGWRERFLFITDDEPEFYVIAEYLIQVGLPEYLLPLRIYQQDFDYTNFYRVFQRKKSPDATRAIINALNEGVVIYNFFGHGGPNIWTAERLFHVFEDLPLLNNADRLSFLTASSCDTAWLDYPTAPVKSSMGELLLKTPDKGCIGVFAPTTGATPADHKRLMIHFFTSLFNFNYRRFGDVIIATKLLYAMEDSNQQVLDQFVLLGDPYVSFNFDIPEFKELQVEPEVINAETGGKVRLYGILPTSMWGWAQVHLISLPEHKVKELESHLPVTAGILDGEINLPPLPAGKKLLRVYAYNVLKQKEYRTCKNLEIVEPDLELTLSYDALTTYPLPGEDFTVNVMLKNPTKLTLPEVAVKIAYGIQEQIILDKKLSLQAGEQWTPKIKLQAEKPDVYRILATASLVRPDDKTTTYSLWQKEIFVPVYSPTAKPAIVVNSREIKVTPEPLTFDAKPTFIIPLYNLTDKAQHNVICEIRCSEDKEFIEQLMVDKIEGWERKTVSITASKTLSAGEKNIFIFVYQSESKPEKTEMPPANAFAVRYTLKVNKYADLIVVPDSMKFSRENYLNGDTIRVEALIKNIGDITANNIEVAAYVNRPLMAVNLISPIFSENPIKIIEELKPGEERAVTFRWDRFGTPGTLPIFVVVNPAKKITESDYSNNTASKNVIIIPEGNLKINSQEITLSQSHAKRGDKIQVSFVVHNDGVFDFKDIQVTCQQLGKNREPLPAGDPIKIEVLQGNSTVTRTFVWEVAEGYNELEINVNPRETLNEANYADNKAYAKVNYVVPIFDLTPVSGETKEQVQMQEFNIKEQLLFGQFSVTNIFPDYKLSNPPTFSAGETIRTPLRPIHIVNKEALAEDTASKEVDRDNHWLLREEIYERTGEGWLEASPFENPSPVRLSIPIPDKSTTYYDVYLVVQTNKDYKGYPASKFKLQIEKEKEYRVCDYTQQKSPWTTTEYYLGRYNLYDGFLDLTIEKTAGTYWTIINRVNFVPLKGTYISPVIDLAELWKKRKYLKLQFSKTTPENTRIECSARFSNKEKIDQWGEWQPLSLDEKGNLSPLTINGRYMQWKAVLYSNESSSPQISTVKLRIF